MTESNNYRKTIIVNTIRGFCRDFVSFLMVSAWMILVTVIANLSDAVGLAWVVLFGMMVFGITDLWIRRPAYTEDFCFFLLRVSIAESTAFLFFHMLLEYYILSDWINLIRTVLMK